MLTRAEYVAICDTCLKRRFDSKQGIVCSLTGNHADFETTCRSFEVDQLAADRAARIKQHEKEDVESRGPFALEKKMFSGGIFGGILMIAGGLAWLIGGLAADIIFYYPIFLIIAGIVVLIKGLAQKAQEIQKRDMSHVLDDRKGLDNDLDSL
jgi:hypothetical protein